MESSDSIEFSAKYKSWVKITKMSISEQTKPEEVVLTLSAIRQAVDRKSFELLGLGLQVLDAYVDGVTKDSRKSYQSLGTVLQSLSPTEVKDMISKACGGKEELKDVANIYLFRKVVQNLKFDFDVNPEVLVKAYPDLRLPKPPGRKPRA